MCSLKSSGCKQKSDVELSYLENVLTAPNADCLFVYRRSEAVIN